MGNMGNIKNIFNENLLRGKIKNNYSKLYIYIIINH